MLFLFKSWGQLEKNCSPDLFIGEYVEYLDKPILSKKQQHLAKQRLLEVLFEIEKMKISSSDMPTLSKKQQDVINEKLLDVLLEKEEPIKMVKRLLKIGADPNARNKFEETALMRAIS